MVGKKEHLLALGDAMPFFFHLLVERAEAAAKSRGVRRREEDDDARGRENRAAAEARARDLYDHGYRHVGEWAAEEKFTRIDDKKYARLLTAVAPLGPPSRLKTAQLVLDGLGAMLQTLRRDDCEARAPADFMDAATKAHASLESAIVGLSRDWKETADARAASDAAQEAARQARLALRDVASAYLRIAGRFDELPTFFTELPKNAMAGRPSARRTGTGDDEGADAEEDVVVVADAPAIDPA